jgi:progressive ankylosis protein
VFLFRSGGIAYQEVGVALVGRRGEHANEVGRGALILATGATAALAVMLFTPIANAWLHGVSGLPPDLARFALTPARILLLLPAMEYWLSFQRSRFILGGKTRIVTVATAIEVGGIAAVMFVCVGWLGMVGVVGATIAQTTGRLASNLFLAAVGPYFSRRL